MSASSSAIVIAVGLILLYLVVTGGAKRAPEAWRYLLHGTQPAGSTSSGSGILPNLHLPSLPPVSAF